MRAFLWGAEFPTGGNTWTWEKGVQVIQAVSLGHGLNEHFHAGRLPGATVCISDVILEPPR